MIAEQRLFLIADKSAVVGADDVAAAFLLANEGDEIPAEFESLVAPKAEASTTPKPVGKTAAKKTSAKKG